MVACIRCRQELTMPDANYCGYCSFPILNDLNEGEVRERAREEFTGFLEGYDAQTILDSMNGDQEEPDEAYQWYLEEGVKKAFADIAVLQRWEWFETETISGLFFQEGIFEDDPPEKAVDDYMLWARVSAFIYEAFQPAGLELSIRLGALLVEDLDSPEGIDVSISVGPDDEEDSEISGPAS